MDAQGDWTSTARRMWLWPVAILVSFPIGGSSQTWSLTEWIPWEQRSLLALSRAQSSERQSGSLCGSGSRGSGFRRRVREWPWAWPREQLWSITASIEETLSS
jgi:hypothetical protein